MISVSLPEHNAEIDFPEGMPETEIKRLLDEKFGPKRPSLLATAKREILPTLKGVGEAALALGTGMGAFIPGILAETGAVISRPPQEPTLVPARRMAGPEGISFETAELKPQISPVEGDILRRPTPFESRETVERALTYEPRTERGRAITEVAGKPFEALFYPAKKAREYVTEKVGPLAGSTAGILSEILTLGVTGAFSRAMRRIEKPIERAEFIRDAKKEAIETGKTVDEIAEEKMREVEPPIEEKPPIEEPKPPEIPPEAQIEKPTAEAPPKPSLEPEPPKPPLEVPKAKEPWEMTKEEFKSEYWFHGKGKQHPLYGQTKITGGVTKDYNLSSGYADRGKGTVDLIRTSQLPIGAKDYLAQEKGLISIPGMGIEPGMAEITIPASVKDPHKYIIEKAISQDRPIPPEVLKDYPELPPKPAIAEPGKVGELNAAEIKALGIPEDQVRILNQIRKENPEEYAKILKGNTAELIKQWEEKRFGKARAMGEEELFKKPQGGLFEKKETQNLVQWVRDQGGIWDESLKGETQQFLGQESGVRGLVSKGGKPFDELAKNAIEDGWLPEGATPNDFLDLLNKDVSGAKGGGPRAVPNIGLNLQRLEKYFEDKYFDFKPDTLGSGEGGFIKIGKEEPKVDITAVKGKDTHIIDKFKVPLKVADENPILKPTITNLIDADLTTNHVIRQNIQNILDIFQKYEKPGILGRILGKSKTAVRDLDLWVEGKATTPQRFEGLVNDIREYLNHIKNDYVIPFKTEKIKSHLSDKQKEYVEWKLAGEEGPKPKHMKEVTILAGDAALEAIAELKTKWGIKDYFPRVWKGVYKYLSSEGKILAAGDTAKQAKANLIAGMAEDPKIEAQAKAGPIYFTNDFYDTLTLRKNLNPDMSNVLQFMGTKLNRKEFFSLVNRTEKMVKEEIANAGVENVPKVEVDMSGIARLAPGDKWSAHFQKRWTEKRTQEKDPINALVSFTSSVIRKIGLEDARKKAYQDADSLPANMPNAKEYIKSLADNVSGKYNVVDKAIDETVGKYLGLKPFLASRLLGEAISLEAKLKLGYAPVKTAINRFGGVFHTVVKSGLSDYLAGRKWLKTPEGKFEIGEIGHLIGMEQASPLSTPTAAQKVQTEWWRPMGGYQRAEILNRPESFAAGYQAGLRIFKGDKDSARQYGIDIARLTQGLYNTGAVPVLVNNPLLRASYQFKQYLNNEIRFMSSLTPGQWAMYVPGIAASAGTRGLLLTIKSIIGISLVGHGIDNLAETLNQSAPGLHRGVTGLIGIDVSAPASWQLPTQFQDWAGAAFKDLYKTAEFAIKGMQNAGWTAEEINAYIRQIAPVGYNLFKGIELMRTGELRTGLKREFLAKERISEGIIKILGGKTVEESVSSDSARYMIAQKKIMMERLDVATDKLLRSKSINEAETHLADILSIKNPQTKDELQDIFRGIKAKAKSYELTKEVRTWLTMPKTIKREGVKAK